MKSATKETIDRILELTHELQSQLNNLEHELRFQPHCKVMIEATKEELRVFKRGVFGRFVDALAKGWIY